jgi:hypothetical protein
MAKKYIIYSLIFIYLFNFTYINFYFLIKEIKNLLKAYSYFIKKNKVKKKDKKIKNHQN